MTRKLIINDNDCLRKKGMSGNSQQRQKLLPDSSEKEVFPIQESLISSKFTSERPDTEAAFSVSGLHCGVCKMFYLATFYLFALLKNRM